MMRQGVFFYYYLVNKNGSIYLKITSRLFKKFKTGAKTDMKMKEDRQNSLP